MLKRQAAKININDISDLGGLAAWRLKFWFLMARFFIRFT